MIKITRWIWLLAGCALLALPAGAEPVQTLDLKPFVGPSPLDSAEADWLFPHGRQVLDGTPFQMDGVISLYATGSSQRMKGRTNVNDIPVGRSFERLHLLGAADGGGPDKTVLARVWFQYEDGSNAVVEVRLGEQVRNWVGPWHKTERPLKDTNAHIAWRAQHAFGARSDNYVRLFHAAFTNPAPEKVVRALSLESAKAGSGLMVVALSVGPVASEPLADTVSGPKNPLPDLRPREGELARGEGIVKSQDGKPLGGVQVRVAGTRDLNTNDGESSTDDPAVGNEATTDAEGKFTLPPLPDNQLYRLLVKADGFEPGFYRGADPKADPIEIRLTPRAGAGHEGKFAVHARVIGPDGKPIAWALVETDGVSYAQGTTWGGPEAQGFPDLSVTGTNGEFALSRDKEFTRVQVHINAPGMAPMMKWLEPTTTQYEIVLDEGAAVRGRVMKEGKPVAGVRIGVVAVERESEKFKGHYEAKTDKDGVFVFAHLPPDTGWNMYGTMASFKPYGALKLRVVRSGLPKEKLELGDLEVVRGVRLAGQVKSRHGEPLPKGFKVRLGYEVGWDSESATVDEAGQFAFENVSAGQVTISLEQRDWRLTGANRSTDLWNPWELIGMLETDKEDLVLMVEKGEGRYNNNPSGNGQLPPGDTPQDRPLQGTEPGGSAGIILGGRVVDDKTDQPILQYKVTPGYQPPLSTATPMAKPLMQHLLEPLSKKVVAWNEVPFWAYSGAETFSNENFAVQFLLLSSAPMLRVEAQGYLPIEYGPTNEMATNLVIRLKRGAGPNGVVLLPDGQPAEKATVIYLVSREQSSLSDGALRMYGQSDAQQVTGKDGKFGFSTRAQGRMLFISHTAGWAEEPVEKGGDGLKVRLKPWATLAGTLVDANGAAMGGVELEVTMNHDWQSGDPGIDFQGNVTTDKQGRFQFAKVPPRRVDIQRVIRMSPNSWQSRPQTWLVALPGITNDLGKVTYDTPPPPPVMDRLKQRLGL
ncbi:MAG: hypothetical protein JWR19_2538 [Pedosphaera sp.]|nr:hypothetical protein [Pedosphaera sp.]